MSSPIYDYAFCGAGAAGLQLALRLVEDDFFKHKSILILEPDPKVQNDRTWCYWEKGAGRWDALLYKSWDKGLFSYQDVTIPLALAPYRYKMLRSSDFYHYARQQLKDRVTWINTKVNTATELKNVVTLDTDQGQFIASHVFDSRITEGFKSDTKSLKVIQHFKGWKIETEEPIFNPDQFHMMDFRLRWKETTGFTYVLPFTKTSALIEYTFFMPELVAEDIYDEMLQRYCNEILKISNYKITETERGSIPMSNYPFHQASTSFITKIGTAGSWVKASTGYSFRNSQRKIDEVIQNLKDGNRPDKGLYHSKFNFYDTLFLDILQNRNHLGASIFFKMYQNNSVQNIFSFLDEETTLAEEIKLISRLPKAPFFSALLRKITTL